MKFFRKKKAVRNESPKAPPDQSGFYSSRSGDVPLDEYYEGPGSRPERRTSRHSPVRRRENENRVSNITLGLLLLRVVLIVVLLAGGFFGLKIITEAVTGPSEKDVDRWEEKAQLMDQRAGFDAAAFAPEAGAGRLEISEELIEDRLERWMLTERYLRSADSLVRRDITDDAVKRLTQALQASPDSRVAQKQLLDIYMEQGAYAQAIPLCVRLLDQDSTQWAVQLYLLEALQKSGLDQAALMLAERMLDQNPNDKPVLQMAAAAAREVDDADRALGFYGRILENDPADPMALLGSAEVYHENAAWADAIPFYMALVRQTPEPAVYHALSQCYAQLEESGKAVIFMGQASSLFGSSAIAPWLRETAFDPVRETVEFRSFADRIVGIETRKAIEAINRREAEKKAAPDAGAPVLPTRELQLRPDS